MVRERNHRWSAAAVLCAVGLTACSASPASGVSGYAAVDSTDSSPGPGDATDGPVDASSGDGSEGDDDGAPESLDLPAPEVLGCQKIDFLFVIDNSDSMRDEQQRLIDGFPGFMQGVRETIEAFDHHVMVTTTAAQTMSLDPCENMLGAGRVRGEAGQDCGLLEDYLNGQRYLDPTHGDLESAFSCLADVGVDGDGDEKTIWSLADAISEQVAPGMCNEGFLRDDALLVVTIISDEEDSPDDEPPASDSDVNSPGDPPAWRQGLVEAKHGDDEAVVLLSLVGDSDRPDGLCEPYLHPDGTGAEPGLRIRELTESFPFGSWASVCQDDYSEFFNDAIADIDRACSEFTPPG